MEQASVHEANARRVPRPHRYGAAAGCERRRRAGGGQGTGYGGTRESTDLVTCESSRVTRES